MLYNNPTTICLKVWYLLCFFCQLPVRIVKFNHSLESPLLLIAEDTKTITIVDYIPDFQEAIQANDPNLPCVRQNTVKEPWHGPYHPSGICFSKSGTKLYWGTSAIQILIK
jgi:hypothetical protein